MSVKKAVYGLVIIGLVTVFFSFQLPKLKFNYDFAAFFPAGDPDLAYYEAITAEFGMYDDFLNVALFGDEVYSSNFLYKVHQLVQTIEVWPEVEQVISPTNHKKLQVTPFGINQIPLYKPGQQTTSPLLQDPKLKGLLFARNGQSVGLVIKHKTFPAKAEGDLFHQKLQAYLAQSGFAKALVTGKVQAQDEFVQRLEKEFGFNLAVAMSLVILALFVLFRTGRGIWIPLLTLVVTCVWNTGLYALLGKEMDALMVVVPTILLIVSMSDIIHLANKYNDQLRLGATVPQALRLTIREVGLATLLTSVTTAIGFLSLAVLPIAPIRDFGIYTGVGILLAYLIAFSLIPSLLLILDRPLASRQSRGWQPVLSRLFLWSLKHKTWIWAVSLLLTLVSLWGISSVRLNTFLLVGLEEKDPMVQTVRFFDQQYDGYKPFELTVTLDQGLDLFDAPVLQALDSVEAYLAQDYGVNQIVSPLSLIKSLNQGLKGGAQSAYSLPNSRDVSRIKRLFYSSKAAHTREQLQSEDRVTWRINGRCPDLGSAAYVKKNEVLNACLAGWKAKGLEFRLTGTAFLIDKTNEMNVRAILSGLLIAIGVMALLILLFTRDIGLTFVSIIPNALPLLMIGGMMGFFGVDLNLSNAIVFSLAFGIAVDDSIHFLSRYVLELKKGRSSLYALKRSMLSTGKSIIITSLVLLAGFAIFLQSGFSAAFHLGFFVCITLVVALLCDLVLLPTLLLRKR